MIQKYINAFINKHIYQSLHLDSLFSRKLEAELEGTREIMMIKARLNEHYNNMENIEKVISNVRSEVSRQQDLIESGLENQKNLLENQKMLLRNQRTFHKRVTTAECVLGNDLKKSDKLDKKIKQNSAERIKRKYVKRKK